MTDIVYRGGPADGQQRIIAPDPDGTPPLAVGAFTDCWDWAGCGGTVEHEWGWRHTYLYERPIALPVDGPVSYDYADRGDDRTDTCRAAADDWLAQWAACARKRERELAAAP